MDWTLEEIKIASLKQHCIGHQKESLSVEDQRTHGDVR